jgi:hypothetical protein
MESFFPFSVRIKSNFNNIMNTIIMHFIKAAFFSFHFTGYCITPPTLNAKIFEMKKKH